MITAILGKLGFCKTLTLAYLLYEKKLKGYHIVTNFKTDFSDLIMSGEEMLLQISELSEGKDKVAFGIDEIGEILKAGNFMTSENELLRDVFTKSRKRGVDLYYTSQRGVGMVDKGVRDITDVLLKPKRIPTNQNLRVESSFVNVFLPNDDSSMWMKVRPFRFDAFPYADMYDTNEIIKPNKMAIIRILTKRLFENIELMEAIAKQTAKKDMVDILSYGLDVSIKVARVILASADTFATS